MTLSEAKEFLNLNDIPFNAIEYPSEADYWRHIMLFPYLKHSRQCKVVALVIVSPNGRADIELQFNETSDGYLFAELYFGGLGYEAFLTHEEFLKDELICTITEITSGKTAVVSAYDPKKRRWLCDKIFDLSDTDDDDFGAEGFKKTVQRIKKRKSRFEKLFRIETLYEIYDWNSYQTIRK